MFSVIFLGTSAMFPTKERSQSSIFVNLNGHKFLLDCGEGTQRQMRIAGVSPMKIEKIFISHWHGDHTLGLAGLIQSMSAGKRKEPLEIYGPEGTAKRVKNIISTYLFDLTFDIIAHDLKVEKGGVKKIIDEKDYYVKVMGLNHLVPTLSYLIAEKGKRKIKVYYVYKKTGVKQHKLLGVLQKGKTVTINGVKLTPKEATFLTKDKILVYIADTSYFKGIEKIAKGADLLISEATFSEKDVDRAEKYSHLTAKEAAEIAKKADAKKLVLTHFSQRYSSVDILVKEAKEIFDNVVAAEDFLKMEV